MKKNSKKKTMNDKKAILDNEKSFHDTAFKVGDLVKICDAIPTKYRPSHFPIYKEWEEPTCWGVILKVKEPDGGAPQEIAEEYKIYFMDGIIGFYKFDELQLVAEGEKR